MIKTIFNIIPPPFLERFRHQIVWSFIGQLLDVVSILILMPVMLRILNPTFLAGSHPIFTIFNRFNNYPLHFAVGVVFFFVLKNYLSIRILKWQSDFYYALSNALSATLLNNFLSKDLIEVKSEKNSEMIKDIIFAPSNFVVYVLSSAVQLAFDALLLALILLASLFINPIATIFLCGIAAILIAGFYYFERKKLAIINATLNGKYNSNFNHLLNAINGYVEIKTNRLEAYFTQTFSRSNGALNEIYSELNANRQSKPKYTETFLVLLICSLFTSSMYIPNYGLNAIFISFLFVAAIKIIPSVNRILIGITNIKSNLYTVDILLLASRKAEPIIKKEDLEKIQFTDTITLSNISFRFAESKSILENVNLTIPKGAIIGITGASGNGKSTLVNILTTLIKPASGEIRCDGKLTNNNFIDLVAYVPQSPFILEGTILENLSLNKIVKESEIDGYLKLFNLKKTIDTLPDQKNTFIGSNGYTLSGGQLQRLALIRALLKKPEVLILDEATNQLDEALLRDVLLALKSISQQSGLTIIAVSHNVSELNAFCDHVYALENGNLIALR